MKLSLYEISLGQLAELVEESRLREAAKVRSAEVNDFEQLKLAVRDLAVESLYLVKRLESEFDKSSDLGAINACLANHFNHIGRGMARIKELCGDPLVRKPDQLKRVMSLCIEELESVTG